MTDRQKELKTEVQLLDAELNKSDSRMYPLCVLYNDIVGSCTRDRFLLKLCCIVKLGRHEFH